MEPTEYLPNTFNTLNFRLNKKWTR